MADFQGHPESGDHAERPARSTWNSRERIPPGALHASAERTRIDTEAMLAQLDTLQSQLNRAGSETERVQRLAMLGELSGFLAHEFNNILTPLLAHSQLALKEPRDPERMAQALARVVSGVKRATAVAESILSLASQSPEGENPTSGQPAGVQPACSPPAGVQPACSPPAGGPPAGGPPAGGAPAPGVATPTVPRGTRRSSGGAPAPEGSDAHTNSPASPSHHPESPSTSIRACLKEALRHFSHIIDHVPLQPPHQPPSHPRTPLGRGGTPTQSDERDGRDENEIRVIVEATPGLEAAIAPIELEQVLMNLALNAKRAIEHAKPPTTRGTTPEAREEADARRSITIRTGTAHPGTTHGGDRVPRGTRICSDSVCVDTVQRTDQSKLNPIYIRTDRARVIIEVEDRAGGFDAATLVRLGLAGFLIIEPPTSGTPNTASHRAASDQTPHARGAQSSGGSGLGLEICRRIVTRAGGWIEIESAPGIGSIVRVVLPASQKRNSAHAA